MFLAPLEILCFETHGIELKGVFAYNAPHPEG